MNSENKTLLSKEQIRNIAKEFLKLDDLRDGITDSVINLLREKDTLTILPTGYGKSTIYHLIQIIKNSPVLIICPLISLQKDQKEKIEQLGIGRAEILNSLLSSKKQIEVLKDFSEGKVDFLFLAPEQLKRPGVIENLRLAKISLVVVDEAHSVSEWGHDFRPDYRKLKTYLEKFENLRILAMTATASPPIQKDIIEQIGMKNVGVIAKGFDRPNIFLEVLKVESEDEKLEILKSKLLKVEKPGIIYVGTREYCAKLEEFLKKDFKCGIYNGGLGKKVRESSQDKFMNGELDFIIATNAFGLGIDKSNIRFIYHFHIPDSVDRFYQEVGRCGRDGKPAESLLFYQKEDLNLSRFFKGKTKFKTKEIKTFVSYSKVEPNLLNMPKFLFEIGLTYAKAKKIAEKLSEKDILKITRDKKIIFLDESNLSLASYLAYQNQNFLRHFESSRVNMMQSFAESTECRRKFILGYFGEDFAHPNCKNCDNCISNKKKDLGDEKRLFKIGSKVLHYLWGKGQVVSYEGDKIVVLFENVGYKKMLLRVVYEKEILRPFEQI